MPTNGRAAYLDSSAIVKLVVEERETAALRSILRAYPQQVSSIVARVEVTRSARLHGAAATRLANSILQALATIALTDEVAEIAASLEPPRLRSLDAIHLASALKLGPELAVLVTYDERMASAARDAGIAVMSPSRPISSREFE